MAGNRANADMFKAEVLVTDPGSGGAIKPLPEAWHNVCNIRSAGAEARSLADPTVEGQWMSLGYVVDGGTVTVTSDSPVNQSGHTSLVFEDIGDHLLLHATRNAPTTLEWRVVSNDGVTVT